MAEKKRRSYSNATIAGLMTLARGACYWPGCGVPTVRMINDAPKLNLEIAHIRAFEEGGKRFDSAWSVQERNSFNNLILLCHPHHTEIDGTNSERYSVEVLLRWKRERESDGVSALAGLSDLTEQRLSEMIAGAQTAMVDRLGPALDEFGKVAPELAALLRVTLKELTDPRVHGFGLSEDEIHSLNRSASDLAHLQDTAFILAGAAGDLAHLQDSAVALSDAVQGLRGLSDDALTLQQAADGANRAVGSMADQLSSFVDYATVIRTAAQEAQRAANRLAEGY
ncbi:HNH endonuclease signature motif containing protein [Streptomyces sp. KE1]|uniref:HNH endonuclease signature motif containing protein n=1 Tax=Streptomyces sp. KE1 TaxID=1638939 RepID=UPI000AA3AEFF|nr:HNH endonuclease signature motif containing protein [Streptomyces sp. KE1]